MNKFQDLISRFASKKKFFLGIILALIVMYLDLFTKSYTFSILREMALGAGLKNPEIKVTSFFSLVYVWNYGVSFGMFNDLQNGRIIFSVIQLSIAAILLVWLFRAQKTHLVYAIGLIVGGALGNLIDRLQHGAVADFLDFYIASYHWPAFNLADSCVCVGVMIIVFEDLFLRKKPTAV